MSEQPRIIDRLRGRTDFLRKNKPLAILAGAVALAGCGSAPSGHEAPGNFHRKPIPGETQPKPVANKEAAETNKSQEIEGSIEGFPLDAVITPLGDGNYELVVSNPNEVAANRFQIDITAFKNSPESPTPITFEGSDFQSDKYEVKTATIKPKRPGEFAYSGAALYAPGLEPGDSIDIRASLPEADMVYLGVEPLDHYAKSSDTTWEENPTP